MTITVPFRGFGTSLTNSGGLTPFNLDHSEKKARPYASAAQIPAIFRQLHVELHQFLKGQNRLSWFRPRISPGFMDVYGMPSPKKIEKGFQDGIGHVSLIFFKFPTFLYFFGGLL